MNSIRLLLDEDVWRGLTAVLREAGYDAVSINDLDRKGYDDEAQMAFAIAENRVMFTHNIRDFAPLAQHLAEQQVNHPGIIVARQFEKGMLARRTLALLNSLSPEQIANTLRFV